MRKILLLLLIIVSSGMAAQYQITVKVSATTFDDQGNVTEQHSDPGAVLAAVLAIDSRAGQTIISNSRGVKIRWTDTTAQDTVDLKKLKGQFPDIEVEAVEVEEP